MAQISERVQITEVEQRLTSSYPQIEPDQISSIIQTAYARFEQSPIRDFIPLLVERQARAELLKLPEPLAVPG